MIKLCLILNCVVFTLQLCCLNSPMLITGIGQSQNAQGKIPSQGMLILTSLGKSYTTYNTLTKPWHFSKVFRGAAYPNRFPQRTSAGKTSLIIMMCLFSFYLHQGLSSLHSSSGSLLYLFFVLISVNPAWHLCSVC